MYLYSIYLSLNTSHIREPCYDLYVYTIWVQGGTYPKPLGYLIETLNGTLNRVHEPLEAFFKRKSPPLQEASDLAALLATSTPPSVEVPTVPGRWFEPSKPYRAP